MAIEKKTLLKKFEGPLSDDEQRLYAELVKATDIFLTKGFNGSNTVEIKESKIDTILLSLVPIRKSLFLDKWKKDYESVGWLVSFHNDREDSYWRFK